MPPLRNLCVRESPAPLGPTRIGCRVTAIGLGEILDARLVTSGLRIKADSVVDLKGHVGAYRES